MKKLSLALIIGAISISLVSCTNAGINTTGSTQNGVTAQNANVIPVDKAKEIALANAGLTSDQVAFIKESLSTDNGIQKYDLEFYSTGKKYVYEINAQSGEIIKGENNIDNGYAPDAASTHEQNNVANGGEITVDKAKEIALAHSGVNGSQATFISTNREVDNGITKYDIEFYANGKGYDYEINAQNGQIIKFDYEMDHGSIPNDTTNNTQNAPSAQSNVTSSGSITIEKAKEIALAHAGISSSQATFVKAGIDFDYGMQIFEIEFYANGREYDYEINAQNGQILKFDYDMEYGSIPNNTQANTPSAVAPPSTGATNISAARAKEIALSHSGLSVGQVVFKRVELDYDDGIAKYEVEFYANGREYDYEISASSGSILSYDMD